MEGPHDKQQSVILGRIITHVNKLNKTLTDLNESLEILNKENNDVAAIAQMWNKYDYSTQIYVETYNKTVPQRLSPQ